MAARFRIWANARERTVTRDDDDGHTLAEYLALGAECARLSAIEAAKPKTARSRPTPAALAAPAASRCINGDPRLDVGKIYARYNKLI